ncbi:MAG: aminopeptidase P family protein [Bacteroidetes bacterium]|nr:MAG: aminopeptidase P family protein [Bacteroidota bacterium]
MNPKEIITKIQELLITNNLDAYIIPSTDPHQSEYVANHWKAREWVSGFTGSAGTLVITKEIAGLWTDSRYFLQAEQQLIGSGIELFKMKVPHSHPYIDWLKNNLKENSKVSFDGKLFSVSLTKMIESSLTDYNIKIESNHDFIKPLWKNRPSIPTNNIFIHDIKFAGKSSIEKISQVRSIMIEKNVTCHILSSLDDIAWLFNIRGNDVKYNPVVISYALITLDNAFLFIDKNLDDDIKETFKKNNITILPYSKINDRINEFCKNQTILLNPSKINNCIFRSIPSSCKIIEDVNITTTLKATKNATEINNIKEVMVRDGVALTKFFYWLENNILQETITELSVDKKLQFYRSQQKNFVGLSFGTISAYNSHGAIVHYEPTKKTDVELMKEGIFLIDSGGQYLDGTTDITRTISLAKPKQEAINNFTLVLKGHINIASLKFPYGTKGYQIDILARKFLWDNYKNYGHGTGHGVGSFLNVHEGPQGISPNASSTLNINFEEGMLTSNEPGIYIENEYGIRIENLILCEKDKDTEFGKFMKFNTVSLCYIDKSLINIDLLSKDEIKWLNDYHKTVYEKISPFLNNDEKEWLKEKTKSL